MVNNDDYISIYYNYLINHTYNNNYFYSFLFTGIIFFLIFYKNFFFKKEKNLHGKVCLITGASSGIGKLMALKFSKLGCKMILWDINFISLQLAEQEIKKNGGQVYIYQCDVSERTNIYKVAEKVKNDIGSIDILINNAGVVAGQYFTELKDEQIEKVIKVNTLGPIFVTKAFLNDMIQKNEGHIVTISSAGGISGAPKLTDYCASKFAVFGFNEALRLELKKKKYNIQTTVVCPFYIKTGMFEGAKSGSFLLPLLEPELVANSVIQAVKRNQSELYLPKIVSITYLVKFLFSTKIRDYISDLLGITSSMDDFSGLRKI